MAKRFFCYLGLFLQHFLHLERSNITRNIRRILKIAALGILLLVLAQPLLAQNTKGDRPQGSGSRPGEKKENRFKLFGRKKQKQPSYGRTKAKPPGRAASARRSSKPQKTKVYPQPATTRTQPSGREKAWRGTSSGAPVKVRSATGQSRNVYPQGGRYGRNSSRTPTKTERSVSNKPQLARLKKLQGGPNDQSSPPGRKKKIVPRSASRPFIARKSINVYASFPRQKRKGEQSTNRDLAGRKIRTRNYETRRPEAGMAPPRPTRFGPSRTDDRPYRGRTKAYRTHDRTQPQKAWKGDIAGRKIRGRNFSSKSQVEAGDPVFAPRNTKDNYRDRPYRGKVGGYRTATRPSEKRTGTAPNPVRPPGMGAVGVGGYKGNIKTRRPLKGGGSVSGRAWNNRQTPLPVKPPGTGRVAAGFPGKMPLYAKPGFSNQGEGFTGYVRRRGRPLKGGGSVSGRHWNNNGNAIPPRTPRSQGGVGFSGNIKSGKPLKGGGSVSGRHWNNNGTAIPVRTPKRDGGVGYSGNIKTGRPVKGGGSVSGRPWNNKETPIPVRTPKAPHAGEVGGYPGKMKRFEASPGFNDQGEGFTGYIKRPKFWKDYIKNDNSAEEALKKKRPTSTTWRTGDLQVTVKQRKYIQNKNAAESALPKQSPTKATEATGGLQVKVPQRKYVKNKNAAEESLLKQAPTKSTYATGDLQVKVRQKPYGEKPRAAEGSLPGIKPTKSSIKASEFSRSVRRRWDYVHNPSSADEALKVREPGKAFAKSTDYQGNIKVAKFKLFEKNKQLHPDAAFVKTNKNNVDSERDLVTNLKLWWARLFRKQETQPDHLKEKGKKPRYDKGEAGMWYE